METAGTLLQRARLSRGLTLEDAARATKMRASQLVDLEEDEYSNFANLAYARGFLIGYGKYLHVDIRPYLEVFADTSTFGLDDYQYLSEVSVGAYRAPTRPWRRRRQRRQFILAGAALAVLVAAACCWSLYISYQRLGDLDKLAERQEAKENGGTVHANEARTAAPLLIPVSAKPAPPVVTSPQPPVAPSTDDNREAAAAIAVSEHSPVTLLTQLAPVSARVPAISGSSFESDSGAKEARRVQALSAGGIRRNSGDADRSDEPQPRNVSNTLGR